MGHPELPRRAHGRHDLGVLQDEDGVRLLRQTLAAVDELKPWQPIGDSAANDLELAAQIVSIVEAHPGVLTSALRDHLPDADGRKLATLAAWLEKARRLRRVRSGKSYALTTA